MSDLRIRRGIATALWIAAGWIGHPLPAQSTGAVSAPNPGVAAPMTVEPDSASIKFIHSIQVAAQADGLVQDLLVEEGDSVAEGQELLKIDSRVASAELSVAEKEAEAAEQKAAQTANIEYAKAAHALAQEELEAEQRLWEQASTTWSSLRRKTLERDRARFSVDVATVEHNQDVLAAAVAKEKVKAAQIRLGLYSVKAPFDAVVAERLRDRGEWIRAGDPVLRLVHMNEVKVEALVPVQGFPITALHGAPIAIQVQINPAQVVTFNTHIDFVSPEVRVNRVRVAARVKNPQVGGIWLLREGMNAKCQITIQP